MRVFLLPCRACSSDVASDGDVDDGDDGDDEDAFFFFAAATVHHHNTKRHGYFTVFGS